MLGSEGVVELEFINSFQGHKGDGDPAQASPYLFSSHGFEHLLQLHSELLSVVHEDAGLAVQTEERFRTQDPSPEPPPSTAGDPGMVSGSGSRESWGPIGSSENGRQPWDQIPGNVGEDGLWGLAGGIRAQVASPLVGGWLLGVAGRGEFLSHTYILLRGLKALQAHIHTPRRLHSQQPD